MIMDIKFKTTPNHKCDIKIKEQINYITNSLLEYDGIQSIVLTGGMTRGEGSAIQTKFGIEIYSDYDFIVVVDKKIFKQSKSFFQQFNIRLTQELRRDGLIPQVDVMPTTIDKLKNARPSMFFFELKETGKILYGDDVLKLIPQFNASSIPKEDSIRTFLNRIVGHLDYIDHLILDDVDLRKVKYSIYHTCVVFNGIMSSIIGLNGNYKTSYIDRYKCFKKNFPDLNMNDELLSKVKTWVDFKLEPNINKLNNTCNMDMEGLVTLSRKNYIEAAEYTKHVWEYIIKKAYDIKSDGDVIKYTKTYFNKTDTIKYRLLFILYKIRSKKINGDLLLDLFKPAELPSIMCCLLLCYFSIPTLLINQRPLYIDDAIKYLNNFSDKNPKNWIETKNIALKKWKYYVKGE